MPNRDGEPIAGLYAAGETVGTYRTACTGATSVMKGAVFGRIAGLDAARRMTARRATSAQRLEDEPKVKLTMRLVSPEGHSVPLSVGAVPRPRSLHGLRIGFLDNAKAPVDRMMAHLEAKLKATYPGIETYTASKIAASRPADERMLKALRDHCDVVINALGD